MQCSTLWYYLLNFWLSMGIDYWYPAVIMFLCWNVFGLFSLILVSVSGSPSLWLVGGWVGLSFLGGPKDNLWDYSFGIIHLVFETQCTTGLDYLAAVLSTPDVSLAVPLECWDYKYKQPRWDLIEIKLVITGQALYWWSPLPSLDLIFVMIWCNYRILFLLYS